MVINELKKSCPRCRSTGRVAGHLKLGISQINATGICYECGGKGFVATELGKDLLKFLKPFIDEMIDEARPKVDNSVEKEKPPETENPS